MSTDKLRDGLPNIPQVQKPKRGRPVRIAEAFPERNPGKYVRIINELADQWASLRHGPEKQPVERHLKIVSNRDHGENTAPIIPAFNASDRGARAPYLCRRVGLAEGRGGGGPK